MRRRGFLFVAFLCFVVATMLLYLLVLINTVTAHPFDHERPADAYQPVVHEIQAPYDYSPHIFRYRR